MRTSTTASPCSLDNTQHVVEDLRSFRAQLHSCFDKRADSLFELTDAILTAGTVPSPPHLSLVTIHRRGWGSLYAALSKGRFHGEAVRNLLASYPMARDDRDRHSVYAVDITSWPRCDAEASPERGYYYHPSRHSAGQPIVAGWAFQLVAEIGFTRDSWAAPVDARRVHPAEDDNDIACAQIQQLLVRLPCKQGTPLFVFDAGYDPVRLQQQLEGWPAQILVRLNPTRVFYYDPEVPEKNPVGHPFHHGHRFDLKDSESWPEPTHEHHCLTEAYGAVRVRAWSGLHPKTRKAQERYGCESACVVKGTVVLVEVGRLPQGERRRQPKDLWLWWSGEGEPDLALLWRGYTRRFCIEHMIRHLKQQLSWTAPRVRHPEQADTWTWIILAAYTQLRLACGIVADQRLPWEKPLPTEKLTPTRVLRSFATLVPAIGTPAAAPKPRGRSPGRPKGSLSGPAKRYPAIKKAA